jgi:AdoMet-dependent rRNA methyltransferase SPB1
MGKTKGKQRQDKYYHLAKEQGYRSRAAFKLLQLDARFRFLPTARAVLDLCAAPGGWLQVAVARAPAGAFVVGVDLVPIRPVRGAHALTEDITTTRCRSTVRRLMDSRDIPAFDVVLHDGSPNVGGAWAQEATAQSALVIDAVRLATAFLAPKGAFVTKVFRSQDFNAILFCLRQLFGKVEVHKPAASRGSSAEIYIVCLKYKAPARIHPELLDIKHLFSVDSDKELPIIDVLSSNKSKKRPSAGYEPGVTVLRNVGLASEFIWSDAQTPQEFLGSCTEISFDDPASLPIKDHELTTDEVRFLCEDLRVLDKNSCKHILRWRVRLRKSLSSSSSQVTPPKADGTATDAKAKGDGQLLQDMEELVGAIDRKQTGEKKRQSRRRAKDKARKATGVQIDDATEDDDAQLDKMLDEAYERYVTKKGGEIKQERKRAKRTNPDADADLSEGREDDGHGITDQGSHEDQDQETSGGATTRHARAAARAKLLNSLELLSESETLS